MLISTKGRYALRFLLDLAERPDEVVPLQAVAARAGISKKYLESIVALLTSSGMLRITRGYQGGYQLARPPAQITVAEVLRFAEGGLQLVPDEDFDPQEPTSYVWTRLQDAIDGCLSGITLQDILDNGAAPIEYVI